MHSGLRKWPILSSLAPKFISGIHMVMVYGRSVNKALIVMKNGKVYSLCEKCKATFEFQLYCDSALHPIEMEVLSEKDVKMLACSSGSYFLALTEYGDVYSGHNSCYTSEDNKSNQSAVPILVNISMSDCSKKKRVMYIACGGCHSLVVTEEGEAFCWGKNDYWQVDNTPSSQVSEPHQIKLSKKIVQIACGQDFSLVVTRSGEVYSWGRNSDGQLGKNTYSKKERISRINFLPRIVRVVCGENYALALTDEGELYAWGGNKHGQLGIDKEERTCTPRLIIHEMGRVSDIAALHSSYISVAVGVGGRVYMWGYCFIWSDPKPSLTRFLTVHDVLAYYATPIVMHKPLILDKDRELSMLECLEKAFNDESTSDLTIQVEDQPIYVHKAILKIRCPYFQNMFQHNWSESNQNVIKYSEYSYTVFKAFLKYLYTGVVDLPPKEAFELLKLADKYCENNLRRCCIQLIKRKTSIANVISLYSTAIECNAKILEDFCLKFIVDRITRVVETKAFRDLNDTNVLKTVICQAAKISAFST